jgi:hypothetical protein
MSMESEMRQMHPESTGGVNRRAFLQMAAGAATGAAVVGGLPEIAAAQMAPGLPQMQTS